MSSTELLPNEKPVRAPTGVIKRCLVPSLGLLAPRCFPRWSLALHFQENVPAGSVSTLSLKTAGNSVGRAVARKSGVLCISLLWVASLVFSLLTFLLPAILRHGWHGFRHGDTKMSPISPFSLISRCCCYCIDHFIASF